MVLTRSARRSSNSERIEWNLKSPKLELLHDHHASKHSKAFKEGSYETKRFLTNADANVNTHSAFAKGVSLEPRRGKLQIDSLVMSSPWNAPTATINASPREGCMMSGNTNNDREENASNFFQENNHDDPSSSKKMMSLHNVVGHKNLATVTADMDSSQRENNVASNDMHLFTPQPSEAARTIFANPFLKEGINEAKGSVTNAEADVNIHSTMAAGETFKPDQGLSKLQTVPLVMSSAWNVPMSDAGLVLQNLRTINADMISSPRGNSVESNDISETPENSHHQQCTSFNLTEIAQQLHDDDMSEVDSERGDSSLISEQGYKVKPEHVGLLRSILSKHGDVAANCSIKSNGIRSFFMQYLCDAVDKLKNSSMKRFSEVELETMRGYLKDIDGVGIEVGWLKKRLHEICEARRVLPMLEALAKRKSKIESSKKQLVGFNNEIASKEYQIQILKENRNMLNRELAVDEEEAVKMKKVIAENKSLKHLIQLESLGHDLV